MGGQLLNHQEHGGKDLTVIRIGEKNYVFSHLLANEGPPLGKSSIVENKVVYMARVWKCLDRMVS